MSGPQVLEVRLPTSSTMTDMNDENLITPPLLIDMHFVPCSIAYSGEADLKNWFHVDTPADYYEKINQKGQLQPKPLPYEKYEPREAYFRGHLLTGHVHPLPEGTIGVVIENVNGNGNNNNNNIKSNNDESATTAATTTTPIPATTNTRAQEKSGSTTRFGASRSKQDALFDSDDDDDFDPPAVASQRAASQITSSQMTTMPSANSSMKINGAGNEQNGTSGEDGNNHNSKNVKTLEITSAFNAIHIWNPHFVEDSTLFSFRQQPIDELIPLAQSLHLAGYSDDDDDDDVE